LNRTKNTSQSHTKQSVVIFLNRLNRLVEATSLKCEPEDTCQKQNQFH